MNTKVLIGIVGALSISACATTPLMNPALESARTNVQMAEADPNVARYAALDLQAAKDQLRAAESASLRRDAMGINQPAYLAAQTARLAQLTGSAKADDARVAAGQSQRERIQLSARTAEVEHAKAESAAAAANQASLQAQVDALKAKKSR